MDNLYDLTGTGAGYGLGGCALIAGKKIALTAREDDGPHRTVLGVFNAAGRTMFLSGFDDEDVLVEMSVKE